MSRFDTYFVVSILESFGVGRDHNVLIVSVSVDNDGGCLCKFFVTYAKFCDKFVVLLCFCFLVVLEELFSVSDDL